MRVFAALLFFLFVVAVRSESSEQFQKSIRPLATECQESTKATDNDVESLVYLRANFTEEGKCLTACVSERLGLMKDGKFVFSEEQLPTYKALFEGDPKRQDNVHEVVNACSVEAQQKFGDRKCEVAYSTLICLLKKTD